jgi:hypothetical protein
MATEQEKYEVARMGVYFEALKENPALQVLLRRLQKKAEAARELLTDVEPEDTIRIRAAQTEVKMFKTLVTEIDSFIVEGSLCEQELREGADS